MSSIEKEFISYEQALALKELGFDEDCFASFFIPNLYSIKFTATTKRNSTLLMGGLGCTAPLKQQVFRWFREKYNVDFYITRSLPNVISKDIYHIVLNDLWAPNDSYKNYEDAESRLIDNLIELAKQQAIA